MNSDLSDAQLRAMYPAMANTTSAPAPANPATAPAAKAPAPAPVPSQQSEHAVLYPSMAPKPDATRPALPENYDEDDLGEHLFKDSPIYEGAKRTIEQAFKSEMLASPEEARAGAAEWEPSFRSFGLSPPDAELLTETGVAVALNPPSEETVLGWQKDSKAALIGEYGDRAAEVLAATIKLVRRDPALVQFLEETRLGVHPAFVRVAAKRAMALKNKGRL